MMAHREAGPPGKWSNYSRRRRHVIRVGRLGFDGRMKATRIDSDRLGSHYLHVCCECPTVTLPLGKIADDDGEATTTRGMNPGRRWSVTGPGGPAPTPGPEGGPLRRCRWGCGLVTHWWLARPTMGAALPLREELPYALRRTVRISTTIGGKRGTTPEAGASQWGAGPRY